MTRLRVFLAALILTAGGLTIGAQSVAAANWTSRCTSGYSVATRTGFSPDEAHRAAARAVWTARYGNFGGWTITGISYSLTKAYVNGRRPGTSLYVSAVCQLV